MPPITWQNVNGASLSDASRPLEAAQRSFNGAFEGLQGVVKDHEAIDAANMGVQRTNNTQSYLDKVAELGKTPEALQAAIANGDIARLHASYGANIDHAATRGAAEALLNTRYAQSKAATEFGHFQADEKAAPLMEAYKTAALKGDKAAMDAIHGQYLAAGGRQQSQLDAFGINTAEQAAERLRAAGKYTREGVMQDATIKNQEGMLGVAQKNAATNAAGVDLQRTDLNMRLQENLDNRAAKLRTELGALSDAAASSAGGSQRIFDEIAKIKDPGTQNNARLAAAKLIATPGMTTGAAIASVMGIDPTRWWKLESIQRGEVQASAKAINATPEAIAAKDSNETRKAVLYESLNRVRGKQDAAAGIKPAGRTTVVTNPVNDAVAADAVAATAQRAAQITPPSNQAGTYGPNGFVPDAPATSALDAAAAKVVTDYKDMSSSEKYAADAKMRKELFDVQRGKQKELSPESQALNAYLHPTDQPADVAARAKFADTMAQRRARDLHLNR